MTTDRDIAELQVKMSNVEAKVSNLEDKVDDISVDVKKLVAWAARREGAEEAIEKSQRDRHARVDLSWTMVMGVAAAIGTAFAACDWAAHYIMRMHFQ